MLVLATQGWQKLLDEDGRLVEYFSYPLTKVGICIEISIANLLQYGCQYIALSTLEYL